MNVQLLLLLALVGPFCSFTHASPTADPTQFWVTQTVAYDVPEATKGSIEDLTVVTGPHPTNPPVAPNEDATEAVTEEATAPVPVGTEKAVVETETPAAATTAPEPLFTDPPAVETAAPTEPTKTEVQPQVTAAATEKEQGGVLVEDGAEGGLGSGQVVGIVIGALLAVVIVIAVVIAAVRRMGKYSP